MNKHKIYQFLYFMLVMILTSCSQAEITTSTSSPHSSVINTADISSTPTPLPEITQTPTIYPTVTATATIIASLTPKPTDTPEASTTPDQESLIYQCLDIAATLLPDFSSSGTLVLVTYQLDSRSYMLNMQTMEKVMPAEDWKWYDWEISPDGKWFTHENFIKDENGVFTQGWLDVIDLDGNIVSKIPLNVQEVWKRGGWLDNERIMIFKPVEPEVWLYSLTVVNPFTGEERDIPYDFPDVYPYFLSPIFYLPTSKYNTALTRVVYPILREDKSGSPQSGYVLRDIVNGKELAFVEAGPVTIYEPKWSPNEDSFVVVGLFGLPDHPGFDFVRVSLDGTIERLTYLAESGFVNIGSYSWSPDGRFLAFWMKSETAPLPGERLAILDMKTKKIINYCVPGNLRVGLTDAPIWSPDGSQIVVVNQNEDGIDHVILVDLTHSLAVQIAENVTPSWWLSTTPPMVWMQNNQ